LDKQLKFAMDLGLPGFQAAALERLCAPAEIQDFINKIPTNFELKGETNLSVKEALRQRRAHCLEAAFIAACALWIHGQPPLIMNMKAKNDDDHAITLFRHGKGWGAISKSNHVWLRWRDPVYRDLRELVMSYFHEYVAGASKSLYAYSKPFDLRRFDPMTWISGKDSWAVAEALADTRHFRLVSDAQLRRLRPRDAIERRAGKLLAHTAPSQKLAKRY
jgi:hypothetical protein